jgi:pimeloyl-ACP methyl ester carboxylesterase
VRRRAAADALHARDDRAGTSDRATPLGRDVASHGFELAVPTLVLHGEDDFIPVAVAVEIAESIPGSVLRVLPACGHFSYLEAPDAVEREVNALLG